MSSKIEILEKKYQDAKNELANAELRVIELLEKVKSHDSSSTATDYENSFLGKCITYDAAYYHLMRCHRQLVNISCDLWGQKAQEAHERGEYVKFINENVASETERPVYEKYPSNLEGQFETVFAKLVFN